jgi:biopolymer transport protein TolR
MAFSMGGSNGGMRGRRFGGSTLSEINVVPLVDVVLVLLIIFMLTAQAMEYGLDVQVPETKIPPIKKIEDLPIVQLSRSGKLYLTDKPVNNINLLGAEIQKRYKGAKAVYLRADKEAKWELIANVFATLGDAHYEVKAVTRQFENLK